MASKTYAGVAVEVTDEGYMTDAAQWTKDIAVDMAKEDGTDLNDTHYAILDFIRQRQANGESLTIRSVGKSGLTDIKGFYQLFPGTPLKKATRYAGVPKPASCV